MNLRTYLASHDSALLRRALEGRSGAACLEIGCGNGGALVELSRRFGLAVGTDLVRPSAEDWKGVASVVLADCARCFRPGSFDLVAFNPPYLPSESIEDVAVDGGADGLEVPLRFLREAAVAVKERGAVVMLLSSENPMEKMEAECDRLGLEARKVAEQNLFEEVLSVYEMKRR